MRKTETRRKARGSGIERPKTDLHEGRGDIVISRFSDERTGVTRSQECVGAAIDVLSNLSKRLSCEWRHSWRNRFGLDIPLRKNRVPGGIALLSALQQAWLKAGVASRNFVVCTRNDNASAECRVCALLQ